MYTQKLEALALKHTWGKKKSTSFSSCELKSLHNISLAGQYYWQNTRKAEAAAVAISIKNLETQLQYRILRTSQQSPTTSQFAPTFTKWNKTSIIYVTKERRHTENRHCQNTNKFALLDNPVKSSTHVFFRREQLSIPPHSTVHSSGLKMASFQHFPEHTYSKLLMAGKKKHTAASCVWKKSILPCLWLMSLYLTVLASHQWLSSALL